MSNPVTPAGIEPATFRFVAQHLNLCATAVPKEKRGYWKLKDTALLLCTREITNSIYVPKEDKRAEIFPVALTFWRQNYFFKF